jgi:hypothetical protein
MNRYWTVSLHLTRENDWNHLFDEKDIHRGLESEGREN